MPAATASSLVADWHCPLFALSPKSHVSAPAGARCQPSYVVSHSSLYVCDWPLAPLWLKRTRHARRSALILCLVGSQSNVRAWVGVVGWLVALVDGLMLAAEGTRLDRHRPRYRTWLDRHLVWFLVKMYKYCRPFTSIDLDGTTAACCRLGLTKCNGRKVHEELRFPRTSSSATPILSRNIHAS